VKFSLAKRQKASYFSIDQPGQPGFLSFNMECRKYCGACCIMPSISSPLPGMPDGKPAGVQCIHLTDNFKCSIYNRSDRPKVCAGFKADPLVCGNSREEALSIFAQLEGLNLATCDILKG